MAQSLAKNLVHLVYSTKGRRPLLRSHREELFAYQVGIFQDLESPVIVINGNEDHVHTLFNCRRTTH